MKGFNRIQYRLRQSSGIIYISLLLTLVTIWTFREPLRRSWTLAAFEVIWTHNASEFVISKAHDDFDVTMASYDRSQTSAAPYNDVVPPVLHHILLGDQNASTWKTEWTESRNSCLKYHPGWETMLWNDTNAEAFVAEHFPDQYDLWKGYIFPVERVDALRYMVLYHYGGVVLDMDLRCTRALGPLRRFEFVAPEAFPRGLSIGFMMSAKRTNFMHDLVQNLAIYNKQWLGLPYATVMFSTGCHYASTIHAYQANRTELKILPGPLHSLNGRATTPLFQHLGSSSWHAYDAKLLPKISCYIRGILAFGVIATIVAVVRRRRRLQL
ncbi:glycosyltransferase family 32 protein [Sarocladium strictum]|jgi:mannosyltransferase OCH1-like enzyme